MNESDTLQQQVQHQAAQALAAHGLVLVQARLYGGGGGGRATLQVLAENPDGSSPGIDDCARASRTLGAQLDVEELIKGRYTLEVSSPGLERPLLAPADYRRFIGRHARLAFHSPQPVGKAQLGAVLGHLVAADDTQVTLAPAEQATHLVMPYSKIRQAQLLPSGAEMALYMLRKPLLGEVYTPPVLAPTDAAEPEKNAHQTTTDQPH